MKQQTSGLTQIFKLSILFIYGFLFMGILRFVFISRFGDLGNILSVYPSDFFTSLWVGARFDAVVLSYIFMPLVLTYLIGRLIPKIRKYTWGFTFPYLKTFYPLLVFIGIADQQYYSFFQNHFNVLMFGLKDDDTQAVMTSMWTDHPLIKILIILLIFIWINKTVINFVSKLNYDVEGKVKRLLLGIICMPIFALAMRGSVGVFPIQEDDASFSDLRFLNVSSINAVFSFKLALREYKNSLLVLNQNDLNKKFGFDSPEQAFKILYGEEPKEKAIDKMLFKTTPKDTFLEKNPPNVVFLLMESMGTHFGNLHSESLNTLGRLKKHYDEDYYFENFLSGENGTMKSIEDLTTYSPIHILAQSPFRYHNFESSVTGPFLEHDYQVNFMFGGKRKWRNLDSFVSTQNFDNIYDKSSILKKYPEANTCEWGVHDEHLIDYIWDHLNENSEVPQFVFSMSVTNHTPFQMPSDYEVLPLNLSDSVRSKVKCEEQFAIKNMTTYQYSADKVGEFMDKLKASKLGENTIVILTGDHNNWLAFDYPAEIVNVKFGVPLYMYVPEKYKGKLHFDASRPSSFKDIFPTVNNLAFSEQSYFGLGNNLFSPDSTNEFYFAVNEGKFFMTENRMSVYAGYGVNKFKLMDQINFKKSKKNEGDLNEDKFRAYQYLIRSYFDAELRSDIE